MECARCIDLRHMRPDDLPDEEAVLVHDAIIEEATLEAGVALVNERRLHAPGFAGSETRRREFVALLGMAVADGIHLIGQVDG